MHDELSAGNQDFCKFVALGKGGSTGKASFHVDKARSCRTTRQLTNGWVGAGKARLVTP